MFKIFRKPVESLHRMVRKRSHAVVYGWPDFEDSVIALEQALQETELEKVVLLLTGPHAGREWKTGPKTRCVHKNSPAGLWAFLTARYAFFTHPCFVRHFPEDVVAVNVWHGMPIKRIGHLLGGNGVIEASHTLASSPFWQEIMQASMPAKKECLGTGLPRNDRLFSDPDRVRSQLGWGKAKRLIAWLPTYRKSIRGEIREDGHEYGNVFEFPDLDPWKLNAFLAGHDTVLWLKPHPMAMNRGAREWSHLKIVDDGWLHERGLSLYALLGASEVLISDISSVVIDYLLLDRPILHTFPDLESYRESRGFSVEPIEDYFCGPVVRTSTEFAVALTRLLHGEDPEADKRRRMLERSHTHQDAKATERLLKAIGL